MEEPPVSIVLRSYNEAWALRSTLAALKDQTCRNWELIVFDSGSTDGSPDCQSHRRWAHQKPLTGLEMSFGVSA